jgi:hypothetical protein
MAKLKSIPFSFKSQSGEVFSFIAEASVLESTGEFSLTIPDELEVSARQVCGTHGNIYGANLNRPRANLRVSGSTLEGCKKLIAHASEDHLRCVVTKEIVILYGAFNKVAYVKDKDGNLYANGYEAGERYKPDDGRWMGVLNGGGNSAQFYQVGLVAKPYVKTTFSRQSGSKTTFDRLERADMQSGAWIERLNNFVGLYIPPERLGNLKELAYTEDAAKFFYGVLISMCNLADRIDSFIGDGDAVLAAIEGRSKVNLLAG